MFSFQAKLDMIEHQERLHKSIGNEAELLMLQEHKKNILDTLHDEQVLKDIRTRA